MNRRGFLGGLVGVLAAPAIVRAESLMPVRRPLVLPPPSLFDHFDQVSFHAYQYQVAHGHEFEGVDWQVVERAAREVGSVSLILAALDAMPERPRHVMRTHFASTVPFEVGDRIRISGLLGVR